MTGHVNDAIPGLLRGDASRRESLTATAHLRVCGDCCDELITALGAHAALMSTVRLIRQSNPTDDTELAVGFGFADWKALSPSDNSDLAAEPVEQQNPLPGNVIVALTRRRVRRRHSLLVAAAAVIAASALAGITWFHDSSSRSMSLLAYGVGTSNASATLVGSDELDLRANLPSLDSNTYYEVWLTDTARTVMTPIGRLNASGTTSLSLSPSVLARFADVEVSVQSATGGTPYSGTSVLRGTYKEG